MTQLDSEQIAVYHAARENAALWRVPSPGLVRISGADQLDFVQRQTTNDARLLGPERTVLTVLTSAVGRILDVWRLAPDDQAIDVITLPGRGPVTARYLQRRIFFMDQVTVTDLSDTQAQADLSGPGAADALAALGLDLVPAPEALATLETPDGTVRVIEQQSALGLGWRLLGSPGALDALAERARVAGVAHLDANVHEVLRVEGGLPAAGRELTDAYTPLETGLRAAISLTKGCYTGQEVLARQINYDKITRRLVGLRLEARVEAGAAVQVEGRRAGEVTSAVVSPRMGPVALAVLKRPHFEAGISAVVASAGGEVRAVVTTLPFA